MQRLSRVQTIALGFILIIALGTVLLMLPIASKNGESAGFLNALFTATSSTCVTGLVVVDTYTNWTLFGQSVILLLIQIGGLGFITIGVFFSIFMAYWAQRAEFDPRKRQYFADWRDSASGAQDCLLCGGI